VYKKHQRIITEEGCPSREEFSLTNHWQTSKKTGATLTNSSFFSNLNRKTLWIKDLGEGKFADWGSFGNGSGYAIVEGTLADVSIVMSNYVPWVQFETVPFMSAKEADELFDRLLNP